MPPESNVVDFAKQSELLRRAAVPETTKTGGGDGPIPPSGDSVKLGKLEGIVEGLKANQAITFSAIAMIAAILLALASYTLFRIDALSTRVTEFNAKVDQLPSRISADLQGITNTLSLAITATKQQPPQIILMPAPQLSAPSPAEVKAQ